MSSERECELYECYYEAHGKSRYCVHHQPIRIGTASEQLLEVGNCSACNSWDDCLENTICQFCISEQEKTK